MYHRQDMARQLHRSSRLRRTTLVARFFAQLLQDKQHFCLQLLIVAHLHTTDGTSNIRQPTDGTTNTTDGRRHARHTLVSGVDAVIAYERLHEFRQLLHRSRLCLLLFICGLIRCARESGLQSARQKQVAEETNEFDALSMISRDISVILYTATMVGINEQGIIA